LAKGWTISGVSEPIRTAVAAAAQEAGLPLGAWVEQALQKALAEGLEAGVSIEEIEAWMRAAVAEELQPVQQALARLEEAAAAPVSSPADVGSPVSLVRERMRQRRQGR
jgi:TRAP-type C4-dicarboxylate transport system substrate-binding protein